MKLENIWKRIFTHFLFLFLFMVPDVVEDIEDVGKIKPFILLIHLKFQKRMEIQSYK